jgi:uncharacterized protein with HEPN domain
MRPKTPALLWDIQRAAQFIVENTRGLTPKEIESDIMLRSAVERQFEIVGEAARRLREYDPVVAASLPDLGPAIGMRNVIAHEYDRIDWKLVRQTIDGPLVQLEEQVSHLLSGIGRPGTTG